MKFNESILNLKQSDIRRMTLECNKHPEGINLSQGICDLDLPEEIISGAYNAIKSGYNIYTRYDGIDELRKGVADKMLDFNNVNYNAENEIVITCGSTGAFFLTLFCLCEKGSEIILFQPFYGYHYNTILSLGLKPVVVDIDLDNGWKIKLRELEKSITPKTAAIVINTPSNPSGKIFSESEIAAIGNIVLKHNIFIITDEIYEYITFDGKKHISPAAISKLKENTITIGGFSKTFSITGWRIGYICASKEIISKIGILNDLFYICAPAPLQKAVAEALKIDKKFFQNLSSFYCKNRDMLVEALDCAGFKTYIPAGAYYMLADFSKLGFNDSVEAASEILRITGVAAVPGKSFYENKGGDKMLRFCFAKKYDILKKACENLKCLK